ncbi:hypothetical protein KSF78_0005029 [Schistosoma japonicum]|nr:hypothetical protein KSF78_0005029 [Schistosoma japonicum]
MRLIKMNLRKCHNLFTKSENNFSKVGLQTIVLVENSIVLVMMLDAVKIHLSNKNFLIRKTIQLQYVKVLTYKRYKNWRIILYSVHRTNAHSIIQTLNFSLKSILNSDCYCLYIQLKRKQYDLLMRNHLKSVNMWIWKVHYVFPPINRLPDAFRDVLEHLKLHGLI